MIWGLWVLIVVVISIVIDDFVGGEAVLVGVDVHVGLSLVGVLVVGAAHEAVGYLEEVVEEGEQQAEEQCTPKAVDMERGNQPRGKHDDECIDDEQEETHAEDGEGKGEDYEDGSYEAVEQGDDDGGDDGGGDRIDFYAREYVRREDGGEGHHHGLCQKTETSGV